MASITKQKNGRKRIDFQFAVKRHYVSLGKMSMKHANEVKSKVEDIIAAMIAGNRHTESTLKWIAEQQKQKSKVVAKLIELGLVHREYRPDVAEALDEFLVSYMDNRTDVKESTRLAYQKVRRRLVDYFEKDRRLNDITVGEAKQWRRHLLDIGLAEGTVNRSAGTAIQFFNEAVDLKAIEVNPFKGLPTVVRGNRERFFYVKRDTIEKVLDFCPDAEWRLLVGLARYGGLRVPSEALLLKWEDVALDGKTMTVTSPKTEHYDGKATRQCPVFPELRLLIEEAREVAPADSEFMIQHYRESSNLGTQFKRIIKKAGVEPWPKLWQNLRSTRVTELTDDFPEHVVVQWLGHSEKVAREHYLQVTDEHVNRAVMGETSSRKSVSKSASVPSGLGMNSTAQSFRKESVTVDSAMRNTYMHAQVGVTRWAIQDSNL
jgi:integrase